MIVLALVNKMLAQVKEDPASVLAIYNNIRRNTTTNINTAMMVYLAQQASGMHFSGDIVNVPGTSVMGCLLYTSQTSSAGSNPSATSA